VKSVKSDVCRDGGADTIRHWETAETWGFIGYNTPSFQYDLCLTQLKILEMRPSKYDTYSANGLH
jgi:hypothetical protein